MKKIVVKFGGSNLKTKNDLQKIIKTVNNYNRPLVIVVSAFYGITNYLTEGIKKVQTDEAHVQAMKEFIDNLKADTLENCIDDPEYKQEVYAAMRSRLEELGKYLLGIHYIGDVPEFVEDVILSYGEKLSALMLTSILKYNGIDACESLPENMGLITDGEFRNASVDFEKSRPLVQEALKEDRVYIVPGFYGVSPSGKINLLGRGGSDYSAAAIASCIEAESLDVWKDVNGYLSADPKIIPNPVRIKRLSYTEAAELSYFGAKILHPRTVEPLGDIPVRIFNIDEPNEELSPLSLIESTPCPTGNIVKSVTYSDNFAILKLSGPGVGIKPGVLGKITTSLDRVGINIKSVLTAQTCINIYLEEADLYKAIETLQKTHLPSLTKIVPLTDLSIIAVVGDGITENHEAIFKMLSSLNRRGIHARIISSGASDVAAYVVTDRKSRKEAIEVIHSDFFE